MFALMIACKVAEPAPAAEDVWDGVLGAGEGGTVADEAVDYYGEVKAILDQHCVRCHADGNQAPSFADPAYVQALAPTIQAYTASGYMPPPSPDPSCREYEGSDALFLDDDEKAVLAAWAEGGAPLGDVADAPPEPDAITTAPFDMVVQATQAYTPEFDADGNEYRCFLYEVGNADTVYVTGLEALVDNDAILHHIVLYKMASTADPPDDAAGYACSGLGVNGGDFFSGWAPGGLPVQYDDGAGLVLEPGSRLVLQMHYYGSQGTEVAPDQSGMGLHLADGVDHELYVYSLGPTSFTIPAGDSAYQVSDSLKWRKGWGTMEIPAVFPHMHVLGSGFDMRIVHDDESETCLVHMDDWDFHNQQAVMFTERATLTEGDTLKITCTYDNSADNPWQTNSPPEDVEFGEETGNEMCFGFTSGWSGE